MEDRIYNNKIILILYILFAVGVLYVLEQILNVFILYKILFKILLFLVIPIIILGKERTLSLINIKKNNLRWLTWILSILVLVTIIITYVILSNTIDLGFIAEELENNVWVNKMIFPFVAIYITFFNAFFEEFFFRGFVFYHTVKNRFWKYFFNSFLFSIYHVGIFATWFAWYNFLLALIWLIIGGLIFSYVNEKNETIINGYIVHVFADIAIILIWIKMFYF